MSESATRRKAVQMDPAEEQEIDKLPNDRKYFPKGFGGKNIDEIIPTYITTQREKVFGNARVNAQIVLGADRPSNIFSGYGGLGNTQCASIDIVVGRMGPNPKKVHVDPNFTTDAARIFISQKTDVDKNFKLVTPLPPVDQEGRPADGARPTAKSAIALKADEVRIISREGIRLVTGVDTKNSQGGSNESVQGIDLIAGNMTWGAKSGGDLQPLVKGENLKEALEVLVRQVDNLNGIVGHIMTTQANFNEAITHHYHFSPFFGNPTLPSEACAAKGIKCLIDTLQDSARSLATNKANMKNYEHTYLHEWSDKYINSRWNNTN